MSATKQQIQAALAAITALAEAIRDLGSVPEGHLYATVMGRMDLETFTSFIDRLIGAKLVERRNHELFWVGPNLEDGR